jgi:hypothetical protein
MAVCSHQVKLAVERTGPFERRGLRLSARTGMHRGEGGERVLGRLRRNGLRILRIGAATMLIAAGVRASIDHFRLVRTHAAALRPPAIDRGGGIGAP